MALERDMDLLVHLDKLNYHEAWVGEHHSGGFEIISSPEMFIAAPESGPSISVLAPASSHCPIATRSCWPRV